MRRILLSIITLFLVMGCDEVPDQPEWINPADPDNPDYQDPLTEIISGPAEGETVNAHTVSFEFSGNEDIIRFSYKLDDADWSEWSAENEVDFQYLDEGEHTFMLQGSFNDEKVEETPQVRNFTVDAVQGPALMFFPRKVNVGPAENFTVDILAEEVEDMMGLYLEIPADASSLELISSEVLDGSGDFLLQNGGNVIKLIEDAGGVIKMEIMITTAEPAGLSGSGAIARLEFRFDGSQDIEYSFSDNNEMRDSDIQQIAINELTSLKVFKK